MKPTARLISCLITLLLILGMWLSFAYLMRDTSLIKWILGLGLVGVLIIGNWVTDLAADEPAQPAPNGE